MKVEAAAIVLTHQTEKEFLNEFKNHIKRYKDYVNHDYFTSLNLVMGEVPYDEGGFTKEEVADRCDDDEQRNQYLCGLTCMAAPGQKKFLTKNLQNIFEQIIRPYCAERDMGATASYIQKDFWKTMAFRYQSKYKTIDTILI